MDPKRIALIAAVGGAVVTVHGVTSKKWSEAHTVFVLLGSLRMLGGGGAAGAVRL